MNNNLTKIQLCHKDTRLVYIRGRLLVNALIRYIVSNNNKYKSVLTLSLFGVNRRMLGVKISLFNNEDCIE